MAQIDKIEFVRHRVATHRRHYVDEHDVKVVLSRLPEELWGRLRRVLFKDDARGRRVYGYTTTRGRCDITLCALPHRVSLSQVCTQHGITPRTLGAMRGSQWPSLAVRRYILYNTLLHELGHLQVILPKASNPNRKFASETKAQEFADFWRRKVWSQPFDHPDSVHNPPAEDELRALKEGWSEAHLSYKKGCDAEARRNKPSAVSHYQRALELYPNHPLALERLGVLTYAGFTVKSGEDAAAAAVVLLRRAIAQDAALSDAHLYLGMSLGQLDRRDEAREVFQRAVQLDPHDTIAMTTYADCLSDWTCTDEAEALFKKVLKKDPGNALPLRWYARHLLYRSTDYVDEETREAIDLLQRAVKVDPNDAQAHYLLGLAYSFLDNHEPEAIAHFGECVRLRPDHSGAAERLAELISPDE